MSGDEGFSLVEVLAALAIASLCLVMGLQVMSQSARASARLSHEAAASDLMRRLLAEEAEGSGSSGAFRWTADVAPLELHLQRRHIAITWTGGGIEAARLEVAP